MIQKYVYTGESIDKYPFLNYGDILFDDEKDLYIKFIHHKTSNIIYIEDVAGNYIDFTIQYLQIYINLLNKKLSRVINALLLLDLYKSLKLPENSYIVFSTILLFLDSNNVLFEIKNGIITNVINNKEDCITSFRLDGDLIKCSLSFTMFFEKCVSTNKEEYETKIRELELKKELYIKRYNILLGLKAGVH